MVMWQILIGRALKAWNDQLLGPARGRVVHAFLSRKAEKRKFFLKNHAANNMRWVLDVRHVSGG